MRRLFAVTLGVTFISLLVASGALASGGRQFADPFVAPKVAPSGDSLSSPMQQKQQVLRQKAMAMEANGTIAPGTKVGRVGNPIAECCILD